MLIRIYLAILMLIIVAGCATKAQQQSNYIKENFATEMAKYNACRKVMNSNQIIQEVYKTILFDATQSSTSEKYELLSSNSKLSADGKEKIILYLNELSKCRTVSIEGLSKIHSAYVVVVINSYRKADLIYSKLLSNEINIGEFNRAIELVRSEQEAEWRLASKEINDALRNDHNFEMQSRKNASIASQNWSTQQDKIYQMPMFLNNINRPSTTNCNVNGNVINCTSY